MRSKGTFIGTVGTIWGMAGVLLLLSSATIRLTPVAIEAFSYPFAWYHWFSLLAIVLGMAYAEGYQGFQKGFSPRVAARAKYLREHPKLMHAVLAPFFCMGYFHATKRRKITSISLTLGIIVLILLVRLVSQPWRGIIDAGVVVGLAWGIVSLLIFGGFALRSKDYSYSPEVPEEHA
jgi:hypothetical protein